MYVVTSAALGCEPDQVLEVLFLTRGAVVAADLLLLLVTWMKTYRHWRQARDAHVKVSMSTCLLRDGAFLTITDQNAANASTASGSLFFLSASNLHLA